MTDIVSWNKKGLTPTDVLSPENRSLTPTVPSYCIGDVSRVLRAKGRLTRHKVTKIRATL